MSKSKQKIQVAAMQVSVVPQATKKTNGVGRFVPEGFKEKTFEQRFETRYEKMPEVPDGLETPTFSESSQRILRERYLLKGGNLEVAETIFERFWHIAYDIASADFDFGATEKHVFDQAKQFYATMVRQEFLPNSPTIMNAGKQNQLQYSACFVLPVEDSIPNIFDTMKYAAMIHQTGGGTGFSFSRIRPQGSIVKRSGGVASGPVSFLRVFDAATQSIKQGGTRRGANMGILRIDHPDVMEFIRCKSVLDEQNQPIYDGVAPFLPDESTRAYLRTLLLDRQISNFNISVAMTDKFMEAYRNDQEYDLIDPSSGKIVEKLRARDVFEEMVDRAWATGDPGMVFIDRINNSAANPIPDIELVESTNPCGEQPLGPWDACNLGSINLGKFILPDGSDVDWEGLRRVTREAVHFLDNVVQVNPYTLPEIYEKVHNLRRIGLGVMGWADMLFRMKTAYDSPEGIELGEKIMKFINDEAVRMTEELAEDRGPFPLWSKSRYKNGKPRRNSTVTTIAPTGTISIIGDCSSGIEPVFALAYLHRAKGDGGKTGMEMRVLTIANKTFKEIGEREGFYSDDVALKVMDRGSVMGVDDVPADWQKVFVTAQEIAPIWHVKMQAAFQKSTENGVSKTINLPNSATRDDVREAYLMAWDTGCDGITVYRDGSKSTQVLNVASTVNAQTGEKAPVLGGAAETAEQHNLTASQDTVVSRPMILRGRTYKMLTPIGEGFITINRDENDMPFEVFITVGKGGTHTLADAEAMGRLVSLSLKLSRSGGTIDPKTVAQKIAGQLRGIGGASHVGFGKNRVMSLADAIAKALSEDLAISNNEVSAPEPLPLNLVEEASVTQPSMVDDVISAASMASKGADLCPECGQATFVMEEGCQKCYSCGYSKC